MTKDEATKFAPIIKAYSEGKTIQFIGEDGKWHDFTCGDVVFADDPNEYRIKPEAKYRPFANAQECWEEMQKHQPFGWVKNIEKGGETWYENITGIMGDLVEYTDMGSGVAYDAFMSGFSFADGKPFGIEDND